MKNNNINKTESRRLASLDILRGFDMFLLVFFQPVLVSIGEAANVEWLNDILYQFDHEVWAGFRFWDIIMPLFMFMCGVSMPFSFEKYKNENNRWPIYRRILKRVIVLWIIGMVVQGNLLAFDSHSLRLYSNTLQAIAAGYLIGSIIVLNLPISGQIIATVILLLIYWIPMTFCGDFTPEGNFAEAVDRAVLGHWRDGVYWDASGQWHFYAPYTYTWIWSSLTFGVTVMLGYFAGKIVKSSGKSTLTVTRLVITGVALIAVALLWHLQMPIIKRLWTCSMTLLAGGLCFLLMALFFWWIDVKNHIHGLNWLKIYGMNSITAYVIGEVINFRSIAVSLTFGFEHYIGEMWYQAWLTFANFSIVFLILLLMYKQRIFIKF
ncbi:MAG: DUF5009 domain-containing protein [Muribaculaceae bacterium]|nr:DUF5009 domain-containing protein [Muribaculaceae bacterium]